MVMLGVGNVIFIKILEYRYIANFAFEHRGA